MNKKNFSPPVIHPIKDIRLLEVQSKKLNNGLDAQFILTGTQEVVKIEFFFWAGRPYEKQQLIARTTAALIKDGSPSLSGAALAEAFDFYGAIVDTPTQTDTSTFSLSCLSKELVHTLPLLIEMLQNPAFNDKDIRAYIQRRQHRLVEDLSKNDVVAYREITACIFGKDHPYGYNSFPASFSAVQKEDLIAHHKRCYNAQNGFVVISGQVDSKTETFISRQLEKIPKGIKQKPQAFISNTAKPQNLFLKGKGQMQSAIRMGRRLFGRTHADANNIYILSTLLGGYFGSRLMTNIREKKGYTYSIAAAYDSLRFDGAFLIDTEVSPMYVEPCLQEIYTEINRLQNDLVPEHEIKLVRNYLMGSFLSMVDGPFNFAETLRTLWIEQLDIDAFQALITDVQEMNKEEIRECAQTYLKKEDLWTVVVGE